MKTAQHLRHEYLTANLDGNGLATLEMVINGLTDAAYDHERRITYRVSQVPPEIIDVLLNLGFQVESRNGEVTIKF